MNTESQPCPFSIAVHTYDALLGEFTSVATGCGLNMLGSVRFVVMRNMQRVLYLPSLAWCSTTTKKKKARMDIVLPACDTFQEEAG